MNVLEIRDLSVKFHTDLGEVHAVKNFNLQLEENKIIGIVGESGSGKTVTVNSILKLLPKNSEITGEIILNTKSKSIDINTLDSDHTLMRKIRGNEISMIFQEPMSSLSPIHKISDQITESLMINGHSKKKAYQLSIDLLEKVGISSPEIRMNQYSFELSGGIKQRIMIAIALSNNPSILIADEPTTSLDVTIQSQILELIQNMQLTNMMSVLYISHDMALISNISDYIYVMYDGYLMEKGTVDDIIGNGKHPYTNGLISSIPKAEYTGKLNTIGGNIEKSLVQKEGCPFSKRCERKIIQCDISFPKETIVNDNHTYFCHNI